MGTRRMTSSKLAIVFLLVCTSVVSAEEEPEKWPRRVLITNDDGIDKVQIIELARAFARVTETYVVAPLEDRSGTGNFTSGGRPLRVQTRSLGDGIHAYGVDGFPADCIELALFGLMRDAPPDLVVSGINTGPNLAGAWMISGTIGAARMAAFFGVPAIAVSGLDDDVPGAIDAATSWVVRFAQSELVRKLEPPRYFAVSIPLIPPSKIRGVRVAERSTPQTLKEFSRFESYRKAGEIEKGGASDSTSTTEIWQEEFNRNEWLSAHQEGRGGDLEPYGSGYLVVVPMIADEHDYRMLKRLKDRPHMLPKWSADDR